MTWSITVAPALKVLFAGRNSRIHERKAKHIDQR